MVILIMEREVRLKLMLVGFNCHTLNFEKAVASDSNTLCTYRSYFLRGGKLQSLINIAALVTKENWFRMTELWSNPFAVSLGSNSSIKFNLHKRRCIFILNGCDPEIQWCTHNRYCTSRFPPPPIVFKKSSSFLNHGYCWSQNWKLHRVFTCLDLRIQ